MVLQRKDKTVLPSNVCPSACRHSKGSTQTILRISLIFNVLLLIGGLLRLSVYHVCQQGSSSRDLTSDYQRDKDAQDRHQSESGHSNPLNDQRRPTQATLPPFSPLYRYNVSVGMSDEFLVPNIVHYIWYSTEQRPLRFHHMLCMLSAYKFIQPDVMYFHTNLEPVGEYWKRVLKLPKLKVNYRQPPSTLFGERLKDPVYYTSHSNVDRVNVLMEHGGIYLDLDVLVTRPFDDLRRYPCTVGREQETKACGSVIVCARESPFLLLWINSYLDDYQVNEWAYNTGQVPFNLARRYPHLVNLDENRINRPNFKELDVLWGPGRFNWQHNYAVHLWYRLWKDMSPYYHGIEPDDETVKTWNSTFGEMARTVLYGTKEIMHAN